MIRPSQAVRLPKEFRFDEDEVCIKRVGTAVLLYPKDAAWRLMSDALGQADADFMAGEISREKRTGGNRFESLHARYQCLH